jgi:hypothetical protein
MDHNDLIQRGRADLAELSEILIQLDDREVIDLFDGGFLDGLLSAILNPSNVDNYPSIQDFLLANKFRATVISGIRYALGMNYSIAVKTENGQSETFVSPTPQQWFDDGVMYVVGEERFSGLIAAYRNGSVSYAIADRDIRAGEDLGPESFQFIDVEVAQRLQEELAHADRVPLQVPLEELRALLDAQINDESKYQELLHRFPWVLGAQYESIHRHTKSLRQ